MFLTPRAKGPDTKATGNDGGYPGSIDGNFHATDMNRHLQDGARDLEYGDDAEARTGNNVILHAFSSPLGNSVGLGFEKPQGHKMPFSVGKHLALEVAVGRAA
jgi:hypothetical protein